MAVFLNKLLSSLYLRKQNCFCRFNDQIDKVLLFCMYIFYQNKIYTLLLWEKNSIRIILEFKQEQLPFQLNPMAYPISSYRNNNEDFHHLCWISIPTNIVLKRQKSNNLYIKDLEIIEDIESIKDIEIFFNSQSKSIIVKFSHSDSLGNIIVGISSLNCKELLEYVLGRGIIL